MKYIRVILALLILAVPFGGFRTTVFADVLADGEGLVIYLDAGHDATHGGAYANGVRETDVNLKIAKYCREELEKYEGVTVYMSRETASCPHPGTSSVYDNYYRVLDAAEKNADLYVSLHVNACPQKSRHGATVYYPNLNYRRQIGEEGYGVAQEIMKKLTGVGLKNLGVVVRNSEDRSQYPDGSLADYYNVIKSSKKQGIPGIIVEHAYVTNASDAKKYLKSESALKKLGVADAKGIAAYYGLTLKKTDRVALKKVYQDSFDQVTVTWDSYPGADYYLVFRKSEGDSTWTKLGTSTTLSYKDRTFSPDRSYSYTVKAHVKSTGLTSKKHPDGLKITTAATVPNGIEAQTGARNEVSLVWNPVEKADGYVILRKNSEGIYEKIGTSETTAYLDTTAPCGVACTYSVYARRMQDGKATYGAYDAVGTTITTNACSAGALTCISVPAGIVVSWEPAPDADHYRVYRCGIEGVWSETGVVTEPIFGDINVENGTIYLYAVCAEYENEDGSMLSGVWSIADEIVIFDNGAL